MRIVTADEEMMQQFVDEVRKAVEKHDGSADGSQVNRRLRW